MTEIKGIKVKAGYRLTIELANGSTVEVDFSHRLDTVRFGRFREDGFFERVVLDGEMLRWGSEVEVSYGELMNLSGCRR